MQTDALWVVIWRESFFPLPSPTAPLALTLSSVILTSMLNYNCNLFDFYNSTARWLTPLIVNSRWMIRKLELSTCLVRGKRLSPCSQQANRPQSIVDAWYTDSRLTRSLVSLILLSVQRKLIHFDELISRKRFCVQNQTGSWKLFYVIS